MQTVNCSQCGHRWQQRHLLFILVFSAPDNNLKPLSLVEIEIVFTGLAFKYYIKGGGLRTKYHSLTGNIKEGATDLVLICLIQGGWGMIKETH